jgi:hypothetical protein
MPWKSETTSFIDNRLLLSASLSSKIARLHCQRVFWMSRICRHLHLVQVFASERVSLFNVFGHGLPFRIITEGQLMLTGPVPGSFSMAAHSQRVVLVQVVLVPQVHQVTNEICVNLRSAWCCIYALRTSAQLTVAASPIAYTVPLGAPRTRSQLSTSTAFEWYWLGKMSTRRFVNGCIAECQSRVGNKSLTRAQKVSSPIPVLQRTKPASIS